MVSSDLGCGGGQILQRRGVVFLSALAAEISLRRAPFEHQTGWVLRLDSSCSGWSRLSPWRSTVRVARAATWLGEPGPQGRFGRERGADAPGVSYSVRAGGVGDLFFQHRLFRTAKLVHAGHDAAGRFVSEARC